MDPTTSGFIFGLFFICKYFLVLDDSTGVRVIDDEYIKFLSVGG